MSYWPEVTRHNPMSCQRVLASVLALLLAVGAPSSLAAQPALGLISGRVDDSKKPFADYSVQLRDAGSGQRLKTSSIDVQGAFVFRDVPLGKPYLVELVGTKTSKVVCTAGPYVASANEKALTPVRLGCGRVPAAYWVLAAAAGTATIGLVSRSGTKAATSAHPSATAGSVSQSVSR
jgi:hypothetical protein